MTACGVGDRQRPSRPIFDTGVSMFVSSLMTEDCVDKRPGGGGVRYRPSNVSQNLVPPEFNEAWLENAVSGILLLGFSDTEVVEVSSSSCSRGKLGVFVSLGSLSRT